tara:strand:+ start:4078 stop:5964 length:1887 start_codon:yes stop_codon:yes gene_type:complete
MKNQFYIKDKLIGADKFFFISEIGNNHNGSFERAINMIDLAIEAKVDCVKFQIRDLEKLYSKTSKKSLDLSAEYTIDLLRRTELTLSEHKKLFNYCKQKKIIYLCTPWDSKSLKFLESLNVDFYKIASADLNNYSLIEKIIKTKKPTLISTGMSTIHEIKKTYGMFKKSKINTVVLHCNSTYPAPFHDINLNFIKELKKISPIVGYSGHERGIGVSIAAAALGAKVIERHFTLDRSMEGPDHAASLTFEEMKALTKNLRDLEKALGNGKKIITQGEFINRENLSKSIVANKDIKKNEKLKLSHFDFKSPGDGISPQYTKKIIGKKVIEKINKYDQIPLYYLNKNKKLLIKKNFPLTWGVPVRFYDFLKIKNQFECKLFEFHLSEKDQQLDFKKFLPKYNSEKLVVHAPELYSNSHLLDLASNDLEYRNISINNLQKTIDLTEKLNELFPNTDKPIVIANLGGFSMDNEFSKIKKLKAYDLLNQSLKKINHKNVTLSPQTMAPYPWHFGGQRYQNLFVYIDEIIEWSKNLGLPICFDTSHSYLACKNINYDFFKFTKKIMSVTNHIHIADAYGLNGEGIQIGDGEINFKKFFDIYRKYNDITFIPEIWQGHKNNGEGFKKALNKINYFI